MFGKKVFEMPFVEERRDTAKEHIEKVIMELPKTQNNILEIHKLVIKSLGATPENFYFSTMMRMMEEIRTNGAKKKVKERIEAIFAEAHLKYQPWRYEDPVEKMIEDYNKE